MLKKVMLLLAIASAGLMAIGFISCSRKTSASAVPFPGLEIPLTSFALNADRDTVIQMPNGSSISYRAGSLVDEDGNIVSGQVDLRYREFHDGIDIALSGIPMDIKTPDGSKTLQTAGMFEINAFKDGKNLEIADGKSIGVSLASRYRGEDYSLFYMDPNERTWSWMGEPENTPNPEKAEAQAALDRKKPVKTFGPGFFVLNYSFLIDVVYQNEAYTRKIENARLVEKLKDYELAIYDVLLFGEVPFGKGIYHPSELVWRDIDGGGFPDWLNNFNINWVQTSKGWVPGNLSIKPVEGNIYDVTMHWAGKKFKKRMEAMVPLKNLLRQPASDLKAGFAKALADLAEEQKKVDLMAELYRTMEVRRLGIYNCDRLLDDRGWFNVEANFNLEQPAEYENIIMLLGDNSGTISIPAGHNIRINPALPNRFIIPVGNNEAEVLTPESMTALAALKKGEVPEKVELKTKRIRFADATEFRAFLGF